MSNFAVQNSTEPQIFCETNHKLCFGQKTKSENFSSNYSLHLSLLSKGLLNLNFKMEDMPRPPSGYSIREWLRQLPNLIDEEENSPRKIILLVLVFLVGAAALIMNYLDIPAVNEWTEKLMELGQQVIEYVQNNVLP